MESKYKERRMARSCYTLPAVLREAATTTERWWSEESSSDSAELADLIESFYYGEEKDMKVEEEKEAEEAGHSALATVLDESEADTVARRLRAKVERAVGAVGFGHRGQGLKMRVVGWLREQGFDAGLCNSSWERFDDGVPAGHHHYIDVMVHGGGGWCSTQRYILDLDFAAEFEIPRPSGAYAALLRRVPRTFSGTARTLERIVSVMCAAIRESMRSAGMPLPPWRRKQYVEAKWLGEYERHTAETPSPQPWEVVERAEGWRKKAAWRVELDGREAEENGDGVVLRTHQSYGFFSSLFMTVRAVRL